MVCECEQILAVSMELGIKVVTVYAFSIENFKRPPDQVETLMQLAKDKLAELCENRQVKASESVGSSKSVDLHMKRQTCPYSEKRAPDFEGGAIIKRMQHRWAGAGAALSRLFRRFDSKRWY